jgi:TPR repeat protein
MFDTRQTSSIAIAIMLVLRVALLPAFAMPQGAAKEGAPQYPVAPKTVAQQKCDELAGSPFDSDHTGDGVAIDQIDVSAALPVCQQATSPIAWRAHYVFVYARVLLAAKRYIEAVQEYRLAAAGGQSLAALSLGSLYQNGEGVPRDWDEAAKWYQRAGDLGYPEGYAWLGLLYLNGKPPNYREAAKWLESAAQKGSPNALFTLASMYEAGTGVRQNSALALRLFTDAANRGVPDAMYRLGRMYHDGIDVRKDPVAACQWFKQGAQQGEIYSTEELGRCYYFGDGMQRNHAAAFPYFLRAAQSGLPNAQEAVATFYETGDGITQSDFHAVEWYRKAAEQNDAHSMVQLGVHLQLGKGVRRNQAEAMQWFEKAAAQGYAPAQTALGLGYMHGLGQSGAPDYRKAARLFAGPARQGDGFAQVNLGFLYEKGWGVNQDLDQARRLYAQAAGNSNPEIAQLGRQYFSSMSGSSPRAQPSASATTDKSSDFWATVILGTLAVGAVAALTSGSESSETSGGSGSTATTPERSNYDSWRDAHRSACAATGDSSCRDVFGNKY